MAGPASPLTFHFTRPPHPWLNAVEGFFAKLTRRRLSAVCSDPSLTCKSPSTALSLRQTLIPSPSSGPPTFASSPSNAGSNVRVTPLVCTRHTVREEP
jgi:transposase